MTPAIRNQKEPAVIAICGIRLRSIFVSADSTGAFVWPPGAGRGRPRPTQSSESVEARGMDHRARELETLAELMRSRYLSTAGRGARKPRPGRRSADRPAGNFCAPSPCASPSKTGR